jgi:hypothetical protein
VSTYLKHQGSHLGALDWEGAVESANSAAQHSINHLTRVRQGRGEEAISQDGGQDGEVSDGDPAGEQCLVPCATLEG